MKTLSYLGLVCLVVLHTLAPSTLAQSNSTVRFKISYGTFPVGDIDVELFDADKPATVLNFLTYAQSGAYSNTIMHHCIVNSFVQGGFGTVGDPTSSELFTRFREITARRAISNEFFTGARIGNTFGTLSMALNPDPNDRNGTLPNSATKSWFFNLRDNSGSFDPLLYTVFGRVIGSTTNLSHFNSLTGSNRLFNTSTSLCQRIRLLPDDITASFPSLPLGALVPASGCPRYRDLYRVEIVMLNAPDVVGPQLTLVNPAANFITTNGIVPVGGTVTDNVAVSNVVLEVNGNAPTNLAVVNNAFSITLSSSNLVAGTNIITVKAYDTSSNLTEVTRRIFYRVLRPITLETDGAGRITGATDGMQLEVGRDYTIVAKPDKGHLFGAWGGDVESFNPTLRFRMEEGAAFTATFGTNLFPGVQGTYNGLFYDTTNGVEQATAGYITLKVGSSGSTSGKILLNGKSYSVKGTLNAFGVGEFTVLRKGTNSFFLDDLAIDLTGTNSQLTGTLSEDATTGTVWTAQIVTDLAWFNGKDRIASQAGKYTVILPADTNNPASMGDGFGAVTVTTKGGVSLAGTLADGTKISQKTTLSKNGQWPLYVPLYKGKGSLISWVNFTNEATTDLRGTFNWFKQTQVVKYYAGGFTNEATLLGSSYIPPGASNAVLQLTNATITFTNGNLAADFRNDFDVDRNGKTFDQVVTNKLKLSINKSSGLFTGSVVPPGTNRSIKFQGALLQKQTNGAGFFLGTNTSGRVNIEAR